MAHVPTTLTTREIEILHLIGEGLNNQEIADKLGLKTTTVITHRKKMIKKFGVRNTAQLIREAARSGLL